jgi:DNA-binding PadR family transcriptional regulator
MLKMMFTQPQCDLLKKLAEKPNGEINLGLPHPAAWKQLEDAGYITASALTRGDLSVLTFKITDAGRRVLEATER